MSRTLKNPVLQALEAALAWRRLRLERLIAQLPPSAFRRRPAPAVGLPSAGPEIERPRAVAPQGSLGPAPAASRTWVEDTIARSLADQINAIPDSLRNEYASRIYRDRDGVIRSTPLTRQPPNRAQNWSPPDIPADALEEIGIIHNHPFVEGLRKAMREKDYRENPAAVRHYIEQILSAPGELDKKAVQPNGDPRRSNVRTNYIINPAGRLGIYR